ncbi:MAG: hypothetical protein JNK68_07805 [Betaproteobacteria bacterium]|nr:hypothetical protein [Betaproteobacteria bacterium]
MSKTVTVFDAAWLGRARASTDKGSWIAGVLDSLDGDGTLYLDSIRVWFNKFPLTSSKDKRALKTRLESFNNSDHLGGVNELSWWEFMRKTNINAIPVATSTAPRPDFQVLAPTDFYLEVSTLNLSDAERQKFEREEGVSLNHPDTLRRLLVKAADEKNGQIAFAASQRRPCALVVFDYTTWSGFGTQLFRFIANGLLGKPFEFSRLPADLSALAYVERKVIDGRLAISRDRSAAYYNPNATHTLPVGTFRAITQFWSQMVEIQPQLEDHWVWL